MLKSHWYGLYVQVKWFTCLFATVRIYACVCVWLNNVNDGMEKKNFIKKTTEKKHIPIL